MRLLLCLLAGLTAPAHADFQSWVAGFATLDPAPRLKANLEFQSRFDDSSTRLQRVLLRASLGVRIGSSHSLWLGYGWTPTANPVARDEHRIFQQWLTQRRWTHWTLSARFRFEQRFIAGTTQAALRWREMIRLTWHPEDIDHWGIILWDEFLTGLNANEVVRAGFDQNRLFLGVRLPVGEGLWLEPGYMNVQNKQANGTFAVDHVIAAYLTWTLTPLEPTPDPLPAPPAAR